MPIPVAPPNTVFSVTIEGDLLGQQVMSVFHYQYRGDASVPHDDAIAALTELVEAPNQLYDNYRAAVPENLTNLIIRYQRTHPVRYAQVVEIPPLRTGTRDICTTPNVGFAITKQCEEAGRGFVGTVHVPGLAPADQDGGFLTVGFKAIADILADQIQQVVSVGGAGNRIVPVLFKRSNPALCPQVTNTFTQDTVRVMRRRTVRVGS